MRYTLAQGRALDELIGALCADKVVYALTAHRGGHYRMERADSWDPTRHTLGAYRPVDPLKALFFPPRERIGSWGEPVKRAALEERIVIGVKSCDLSSLAIQDHVFLGGGVEDPGYAEARARTLIVTSDCTDHSDSCFCAGVGEQPYPTHGYDVNISATGEDRSRGDGAFDGCLIESGSERGEQALAALAHLLRPAAGQSVQARDARRALMLGRLSAHSTAHGVAPGTDLRAAVEGAFDADVWEAFATECVECGACNFACCTCHCFLLADGLDEGGCPVRNKQWDACLFRDFGRTAGGGNPRPRRSERLRNRFDKKFSFFPQTIGRYACDGCGRCTDACIASIDIRAVLKRAMDESVDLHADAGGG
jgi:hypothetical protein